MKARVIIEENSVPRWSRGVRLRFDGVRKVWMLMAPERVLMPDAVALDIMQKIDGARSVGELVDLLADAYEAERAELAADTLEFLQGLADRSFLSA